MRKYGRLDANQNSIVSDLRKIGYSVFSLASLGNGAPDICVGIRDKNYLFEIKDPEKPKSARKLTEDEREFFDNWKGQVHIAEYTEDVLKVIAYD